MNHLYAPVIFGLAASLCWGSGDFSGGLASRRANVGSVVLTDYAVGLVLLVALALIGKEPVPALADLLWGGLAGVAGVIGLLSFYAALARGKMGIAAPISAVLTAALPVLFSAFTAGVPAPLQLAGFALAGLAIGLISWPQRTTEPPTGIGLALLAGCGFGCFFILISRVHPATTYWSLAAARCTSIAVLLPVMRLRRKPLLPPMTGAPLVVLAGILDALGNVLFVFAAHSGRRAARARDTRTDHRCAARAPGHPCDLGLSHFLFYPLDTVSIQSVLMDALCLKSPKSRVFSVGPRA